MDTITQFVLGGAVGEAVLGRKVGNKAIIWGGIAGTIPDLDVLARPFVSEVTMLGLHRGFSHSIVFAFLLAPVFGWLVNRFYQNRDPRGGINGWSWLFFWGFLTHTLLDSFTAYGTQLFQPFSDYPVAFSSIFIIDPVYTIPFIAGLFIIWRMNQQNNRRRLINYGILAFTTAYLLLSFAIKLRVDNAFQEALAKQEVSQRAQFSAPLPMNIFLWMGIAQVDDHLLVGTYSIFDPHNDIKFKRIERNSHLIADNLSTPTMQRLLWFSRGNYHVQEIDGELYFYDLRFGRSDFWMKDDGAYVFTFHLLKDPAAPDKISGFDQQRPGLKFEDRILEQYWARIWARPQ